MLWCAYEELCVLGAEHEAQEYINLHSGSAAAAAASAGIVSTAGTAAAPQQQPQSGGFTFAAHTPPGQQTPAQVGTGVGATAPIGGFIRDLPRATPQLIRPTTRPTPLPTTATDRQQDARSDGVVPMDQLPPMTDNARGITYSVASSGGGGYENFTTPEAIDLPSGPPPIPQRGAGGGAVVGAGVTAWPPSTAAITPSALPGWGTSGGRAGSSIPQQQRKFLDEGKMRKISSKLFSDPASVLRQVAGVTGRGGGGGGAYTNNGNTNLAGTDAGYNESAAYAEDHAAMIQTAAAPGVPRGEKTIEGQAAAVGLLQLLGEGYRLLCSYKCQEAVDAFSRLPENHLHTGWALIQLGRAYFEQVDYDSSAFIFEQARKVDPYRLQGIEVYSTVLWHMKREVELSALAQEALALDRESPAAWCIMGNCFSLQKEHESSLRFFQRALQVDNNLPYAYTLCGHEYFANEDFEKGITCYRTAIRIDPRHYNAWFGMGHIYYRQEKFGMAEYHFRRAHVINNRSSVLRCYLGMSLHKLKRSAEALQVLGDAIVADPRNPLARFERAGVLAADGRLDEALSEFQALHDVAPREASVLFHMGKVFKRLGRIQDALAAFSEALDLQPPSADTNLIKSAIDRVTQPDAEEEEEV
jgi:anaphase-promoting complex subunit 3